MNSCLNQNLENYIKNWLEKVKKLPDGSYAFHGSPPITKMGMIYILEDLLKHGSAD